MAVALYTDRCLRVNRDNEKHELKRRFFAMWNLYSVMGPDTAIYLGKKCFERYFYYFPICMKWCLLIPLKSPSTRGASHHPVSMSNCPTISHTSLALSTQWMSFLSRKWRRGVSPRCHLIVLCLMWIKRNKKLGGFNPSLREEGRRGNLT